MDLNEHDVLSFYDQVEIQPSYGRIPVSHTRLAHFSKGDKPKSLMSKRNQIFLEFKSNEKKTGKGFAVYYHTRETGSTCHFILNLVVIIKINPTCQLILAFEICIPFLIWPVSSVG